MSLGAAFNAIFQDRDWTTKFLITTLIIFFTGILSPLLIGLVGGILLVGYQVEIARRVRANAPTPLPRWDDYAVFLAEGLPAAIAYFVYMLPIIVAGIVLTLFGQVFSRALIGSLAIALVSCCIVPFTLIYFFTISAMHAIATTIYAQERRAAVYYQIDKLFSLAWRHIADTLQYIIVTFLLGVILALIGLIPCLGWIAAPALGVIVAAILGAQYADTVLGR
ncbi:MAG: hypothetical protein CUN53_11065 [Phototrophicales bacterium]|nr:MAG: hypothetical protein CUN53_11065 [Phototrophicales bacterium]